MSVEEQSNGEANVSAAEGADTSAQAVKSDQDIFYAKEEESAQASDEAKGEETAQGQAAASQEEAADDSEEKDAGSEGDGAEEEGEETGAPEAYEDFNLPEGFEMDQEILDQFLPFAKEQNLTQKAAQQAVDFAAQIVQRRIDEMYAAHDEQLKSWDAELMKDKDIGGAKLEQTQASANRVYNQFGSPELRDYLNQVGAGRNPAFLRMMSKIGQAFAEDGAVHNDAIGGEVLSDAEVFYGKS